MRLSRPLLVPYIGGLLAIALALPAQAQRLLDWQRRETRPQATAQPADSHDAPWLQLRRRGEAYEAWASNPWAGPAQVVLRGRQLAGFRADTPLPASSVLGPGERRLLARLLPTTAATAPLDLELDGLPGAPGANVRDVVYQLPFDAPARIDQGFDGAFSHHDAENRYALDFALPEGTPVLAARAGTVMQVQAGFHEAGLDRERFGARANVVRILHDDGSMALYAHLSDTGIVVIPGQHVRAGQPLGRSGNTGLSSAPHLHFVIQANAGGRLQSLRFRMRGPLGELRFADSR